MRLISCWVSFPFRRMVTIWQADKAAGKVPSFAGQQEKPGEYWRSNSAGCSTRSFSQREFRPGVYFGARLKIHPARGVEVASTPATSPRRDQRQLVAGDEAPPATLRHSVEGCRTGCFNDESMTQTSTKAGKVQASPQEPAERCPKCGNHAQLENGHCVTCSPGQPQPRPADRRQTPCLWPPGSDSSGKSTRPGTRPPMIASGSFCVRTYGEENRRQIRTPRKRPRNPIAPGVAGKFP